MELEGSGEFFTRIAGATRLANGMYAVADEREQRIHVYTNAGRLHGITGRRGAGPGEYQYISGIWSVGDTIGVWDARQRRVTMLRPDGAVVRTASLRLERIPPEARGGSLEMFMGALPDGSLVISWLAPTRGRPGAPGADIMVPGVFTAGGVLVRTLGAFEGMTRFANSSGSGPHVFSGFPWSAVIEDSLAYTDGLGGAIRIISTTAAAATSARMMKVRMPATGLPDAWEAFDSAAALIEDPSAYLRLSRAMKEVPTEVPDVARMIADADGLLWLKEYEPGSDAMPLRVGNFNTGGRWRIIDREGSLMAMFNMPRNVAPLAIYGDEMLVLKRDELNVETFAVYSIVK